MTYSFTRILLATEHTEFDAGAERVAFELAKQCGVAARGRAADRQQRRVRGGRAGARRAAWKRRAARLDALRADCRGALASTSTSACGAARNRRARSSPRRRRCNADLIVDRAAAASGAFSPSSWWARWSARSPPPRRAACCWCRARRACGRGACWPASTASPAAPEVAAETAARMAAAARPAADCRVGRGARHGGRARPRPKQRDRGRGRGRARVGRRGRGAGGRGPAGRSDRGARRRDRRRPASWSAAAARGARPAPLRRQRAPDRRAGVLRRPRRQVLTRGHGRSHRRDGRHFAANSFTTSERETMPRTCRSPSVTTSRLTLFLSIRRIACFERVRRRGS